MERYIKYKRMVKEFADGDLIQEFFDTLISEGWEIIYYDEKSASMFTIKITVVVGKKQDT